MREEITRHEIFTPVYYTLFLVNKYMHGDFNLPRWLEANFAGLKYISPLEQKIFADTGSAPDPAAPLRFLTAGFRGKMSIILHSMFPARKTMAKRYSVPPRSAAIHFYYLMRPFELVVKYGKSVMELFRFRQTP